MSANPGRGQKMLTKLGDVIRCLECERALTIVKSQPDFEDRLFVLCGYIDIDDDMCESGMGEIYDTLQSLSASDMCGIMGFCSASRYVPRLAKVSAGQVVRIRHLTERLLNSNLQ